MKIVVLAGGISTERAVSLVTGSGVCRALRENGHQAILVDLFLGVADAPGDLNVLFDAPDGLCPEAKIEVQAPDLEAVKKSRADQSASHLGPHVLELCALADIVFLGLHGRTARTGPYPGRAGSFGGALYRGGASGLRHRPWIRRYPSRSWMPPGIPTPKWKLLEYGQEDAARLAEELPMPCVVKTIGGGSSLGVYLPEDRAQLRAALGEVLRYGAKVLVEERIYGRELTVAVLGERWLPAVETVPAGKEFDYEAKYQAGAALETCPADLTPEQMAAAGEMALRVHKALGLEVYSRTDMILDEQGRLWCLEANSLPGMTPTSFVPKEAGAVGMSYNQLCEEIVQRSYRLKRRAY